MKVIKQGNIPLETIFCKECECIFEIFPKELQCYERSTDKCWIEYIYCPCCNSKIIVSKDYISLRAYYKEEKEWK